MIEGLRTVQIGSVGVHDVDAATTDRIIHSWLAAADRGRAVCTPNVDYVVRAGRDPCFRAAILSCDLRVPDGMWIVYASRIAGRRLDSTVTGRLLVPRIARHCRDRGLSVALVGAAPGVAAMAAERLAHEISGLRVVGSISPPMGFVVRSPEDSAVVEALRQEAPAVVFVALGAPRQEIWMAAHRDELAPAVLIGVGQAFDVIAGRVREAPRWMTRVGLEWAFRLAQEPRRLARRYLVDDPWILWWALRTRVGTLRRVTPRS